MHHAREKSEISRLSRIFAENGFAVRRTERRQERRLNEL